MYSKYFCLLLLFSSLFIGTINVSGQSYNNSQSVSDHNFFPLHSGNEWQVIHHFSCPFGYTTCGYELKFISVGDRIVINDTVYHKVSMEGVTNPWRYDRAEHKLIFRQDNQEYIYLDLGLAPGEAFTMTFPGELYTKDVTIYEDTLVVFGDSTFCKGYHWLVVDGTIEDVLFADKFGFAWLDGKYIGLGPDATWEEFIPSAKVYADTGFSIYAPADSPWIAGNDLPPLYDKQFYSDQVNIYSEESFFCSGVDFIDYIDSAVVEIFYSQGPNQTSTEIIQMNHIPESVSWNYFLNLNPLYFENGYALNLRFKVWNRSYNNIAYPIPADGWYKMKYEEPVGVDEENIPSEYSLSQNFPNPFNPSTIITYSLADEAFVELEVFDILGNSVACLVNGKQAAGEYSIDFNGDELSSGVYLCKFSALNGTDDKFSKTVKMILLK